VTAAAAPPFRYRRVLDLSRPLVPGQDAHPWLRFDVRVRSIVADVEHTPMEGRWYVVSEMTLSGHAGTHVEAPMHARANGASVGMLPVESFFGETVVLDLSDTRWAAPFTVERIQSAARQAGRIQSGDIVFFRFDWDRRSGANGGHPPYPEPPALRWLVDQGIKLLGIDSPGLEVPGDPRLPNHHQLFDRNIPLIESLAHLEDLRASRIYVFAQPLPAFGSDAIPLRVLAFEGEGTDDRL
jgi:kynurenine formamidase